MRSGAALRLGVSAVLFVNAFLVFVLQPHVSKRLLPVLGGGADVWTVCALFFQLALLGGYVAAYLARRLPPIVALGAHAALVGLVWLLWPVTIGDGPPPGASPPAWTLAWLSTHVGLLFVVLTATSPLWMSVYGRVAPDRDPYPLFAASNAGSLAGLFAYPILVEPLLTLDGQARAWSTAALLLLGLIAVTAAGLRRAARAAATPAPSSPPPAWSQRLRWLLLSLVPSTLMLSVTAAITTDIAPVPLLWTVPLGLYLASLIRVFSRGWRPSRWTWPAVAVCSLPALVAFVFEPSHWWWIALHLSLLWSAALMCHGLLVQERPGPDRLAEFYLWMAAGGALGGVLSGVIAPLAFTMRSEYPLAVFALIWLAPRDPVGSTRLPFSWRLMLGLLAIAVAAGLGAARAMSAPPAPRHLLVLFPVVAAIVAWHRPRLFATCASLAFVAAVAERQLAPGGVLLRGRSFYGVHSVRLVPELQARALFHGTTLHGLQSLRPGHEREPLAYYGYTSPVADVFRERVGAQARVALVGLGAGAMLRYASPGMQWTVYEIDPAIAALARQPALFSHWTESAVTPALVIGDGRLRLRDAPDHGFDVIVLDAFASDAIPVHLLTREALAMYVQKLRPGGMAVFNVSNRYIDMPPILGATAATLGLAAYVGTDETDDVLAGLFTSTWVLVGDPVTLPAPTSRWTRITPGPLDRAWTDDYSNVLAVLRPVRELRELISALIHY